MRKALQFALFLAVLVATQFTRAQTAAVQNYCTTGGVKVLTSGLPSTTTVQASYPKCLVTVYLTGTTNLATIYKDSLNTPQDNPFIANADASWLFYSTLGIGVDIFMSGGTPIAFPTPKTLTDVIVGSGGITTSVNTLIGAVTLIPGNNVTITPTAGNSLTISATGGGGGGGVIASPQFQKTYFPNAGTIALVQGDTGSTTDGAGNEKSISHAAFNPFVPFVENGPAVTWNSQNYQDTNSSGTSGNQQTTPWNYTYTQTQRNPSGTNAALLNITANDYNGSENTNYLANNTTLLNLIVTSQNPQQIGGAMSQVTNCLAQGDCVPETGQLLCMGQGRGEDEGCEWLKRFFANFQTTNFGGLITRNAPDATGQIFATFVEPPSGPYANDFELNKATYGSVVADMTTRTAVGNVISSAFVGNNNTIQLDTNHGLGVSTKAFLTAPILSWVYSDACGVGQTGTSWSASGGVITLHIANSYSVGQNFSIEGMQDNVGFQLDGGSYVAGTGTNSTTIVITSGIYWANGDLTQFPNVASFPNTATVTETFKTVRTTGQQYPTTGPNINSGDGFATLPNGQGLGTINANYVNDTTNTLVGFCASVNSTAGFSSTSPNDQTFITDTFMTAEYDKVKQVVDGTHLLLSFAHAKHPYGSPVTTGGGVGKGLTMGRDLLPPGTLSTPEWGQFAPAMLTYPIISTPDSTHVEIFTNAAVSGGEWKTLAFAGNTPFTPMAITATSVVGGVVTGISFTPNDYRVNPVMPGGSPFLPAPALTWSGCTTNPVLQFRMNHGQYIPSLVSGGTGCSSPTVVVNNTYANPAFVVSTTMSRSIINPATGAPCAFSTGCELLDYMPPGLMANGDLVANEFHPQQYASGFEQYSGSRYVDTSQHCCEETNIQYQYVQSGAFLFFNNTTPETEYFGTPAELFAPNTQGEGRVNPAPFLRIDGANDGFLFGFPPMSGLGSNNSRYTHGNGPGYGGDAFTWGCGNNVVSNYPCQIGQFDEFGVFNFFATTFLSYNLNDTTMRLYTGNFLVPGTANYIGAPTFIMPDTLGGPQAGLHNAAGIVTFDGPTKGDGIGNIGGAQWQFDQGVLGVNLSTGVGSGGVVGAPGTCAVTWAITAVTRGGAGESPLFEGFGFGNSPNVPTSSNYAFSAVLTGVVGATGYNTYRIADACGHTAPALICANIPLAAMMTNTGCKDLGQAGTAGSPPTVDTTGSLIFNGSAPIVGLAGSGTLLQTAFTGPPYLSTGTTSNEDLAGHIAMTGSAVTYTFQNTLTAAPNCVVSGQAHPVTYTISNTTLTMTGTAADTANWVCIGTTP